MPHRTSLSDEDMTRLIEEYLEACYRAHSVPRVSEFSASIQRKPRTVRRRVARMYGMPLGQLLRQKRLQKAAALLRTTDLTVDAVIDETAAGDRRAFFRAFRAAFHATPLEYRLASRSRASPTETD